MPLSLTLSTPGFLSFTLSEWRAHLGVTKTRRARPLSPAAAVLCDYVVQQDISRDVYRHALDVRIPHVTTYDTHHSALHEMLCQMCLLTTGDERYLKLYCPPSESSDLVQACAWGLSNYCRAYGHLTWAERLLSPHHTMTGVSTASLYYHLRELLAEKINELPSTDSLTVGLAISDAHTGTALVARAWSNIFGQCWPFVSKMKEHRVLVQLVQNMFDEQFTPETTWTFIHP